MALVLGMDTGGTFTDGVIVNTATKEIVCKAKSPTTKENLTKGIKNCIEQLDESLLKDIKVVCLSTTLATNAVVEGKGSKAALIYMGFDDVENVPAEIKIKVSGKIDVMGNIIDEIDLSEITKAIEDIKNKVEAVVISGYASVKNPKHEKAIAAHIKEISEIPVVCAHQLTSALGFNHRTVTAVLNAKLISVISELLKSTRTVLDEKEINAAMMIVKGDGTLMTEEMAKAKPIETILSGPAASVIGGLTLTNEKEGIIIDMGGTTTDIAHVEKGKVRIKKEGARVGGWNTRVQAIDISTFGIGGDSRIYLDDKGNNVIGPQRAVPLCVASVEYPGLADELKKFMRKGDLKRYYPHEAECYMLNSIADISNLTEEDYRIIELIKDRPHSSTYIARKLGYDPEILKIGHLADKGILIRIGVTPTDVLHALGKYEKWDKKISNIGIQILAERAKIPFASYTKLLERDIKKKLAVSLLQSTVDFNEEELTIEQSKEAMYLVDTAFKLRKDTLMDSSIIVKKPVVALGAPAGVWLKALEEYIDCSVIVPENADVANAYGAAVGEIIEEIVMQITVDGSYVLNMPWERKEYTSKAEAEFYAVHEGRKYLEHMFAEAGFDKYEITDAKVDNMVEIDDDHNKMYTGTTVTITGKAHTL